MFVFSSFFWPSCIAGLISHTTVGSHAESRLAKERACRASAGTPCIATRSRHREAEKSPHLAAREQCSDGGVDMQAVQHVELCFQQVMSAVPQEEAPAVSQCWQKERQGRSLRQEETVVGSHQNAPRYQTAVRGRRGLGRLRLASGPGRGRGEAADHREQANRFADLGRRGRRGGGRTRPPERGGACENATPPLPPSFSARNGKPSNPWSIAAALCRSFKRRLARRRLALGVPDIATRTSMLKARM